MTLPRSTRNFSIVEVDYMVALKIIKHCEQEISGLGDLIQGFLMGLVVEDRLEVTNCMPNPKHTDSSDEINRYQIDAMRNLRMLKHDSFQVGWYQNTPLGNFISVNFLDSQFNYQDAVEESIVLVFDHTKTAQGFLSMKAYHLTPLALKACKESDYSPEKIRKLGLSYDDLFQEIPVVIKSSNISNVLLSQMDNYKIGNKTYSKKYFDLDFVPAIEQNLRIMMVNLEELTQETNKLNMYYRQNQKIQIQKQAYMQKRKMENDAREAKGMPRLPEEDLDKLFKPLPCPPRLDSLLLSGQIANFADKINRSLAQSMGKLIIIDALRDQE